MSPLWQKLEKLHDFVITHLKATGTCRSTQSMFVVRAVDIDITLVGIDFSSCVQSLLQTSESKNPRCNQVLFSFLFCAVKISRSNRNPPLEHCPEFLTLPYFLAHVMQSGRCAKRTLETGWFSLRT